MRLLLIPLLFITFLWLTGCNAEQLARDAEAAHRQVEQIQLQVQELESLIAVLPEGAAKASAVEMLAGTRSALLAASTAAEALSQSAARAAAGGGLLDIGIGIISIFVPAAGAVYYHYKQSRKHYGAFRETVKALDHAKPALPPDAVDKIHKQLYLEQSPSTRDLVDAVQGKKVKAA